VGVLPPLRIREASSTSADNGLNQVTPGPVEKLADLLKNQLKRGHDPALAFSLNPDLLVGSLMSSTAQTVVALALVALAACWLVLGALRKRRRPGCGGDCGCTAKDLHAKPGPPTDRH
jgi:hypothetical protein